MDKWTAKMVEERLVDAAQVMRRLPSVRIPGYFNTWPKMLVEFADRVGQKPEPMRLPPPSTAARYGADLPAGRSRPERINDLHLQR